MYESVFRLSPLTLYLTYTGPMVHGLVQCTVYLSVFTCFTMCSTGSPQMKQKPIYVRVSLGCVIWVVHMDIDLSLTFLKSYKRKRLPLRVGSVQIPLEGDVMRSEE